MLHMNQYIGSTLEKINNYQKMLLSIRRMNFTSCSTRYSSTIAGCTLSVLCTKTTKASRRYTQYYVYINREVHSAFCVLIRPKQREVHSILCVHNWQAARNPTIFHQCCTWTSTMVPHFFLPQKGATLATMETDCVCSTSQNAAMEKIFCLRSTAQSIVNVANVKSTSKGVSLE